MISARHSTRTQCKVVETRPQTLALIISQKPVHLGGLWCARRRAGAWGSPRVRERLAGLVMDTGGEGWKESHTSMKAAVARRTTAVQGFAMAVEQRLLSLGLSCVWLQM